MKLTTPVIFEKIPRPIRLEDKICVLGSCFADEIGTRLKGAGFSVLANPFGTLYNPASLAAAVQRLDSGEPFTHGDCVEMGAGAGRICSYSHHTSFARADAQEFLDHANACLADAAAAWQRCSRVIVTLGTAWVWRALERPGRPVVANCLKRAAREFAHELLSVDTCAAYLRGIVEAHPDKEFLFTVSPIRHLGEGARANTLSKSTLHLAVQQTLASYGSPAGLAYFPAYEILMDELRDYRFYADDLVHPAPLAVQIIWERFLDACTDPSDRARILENEKAARAGRHRTLAR
ncbi:MAG: GSCFA domain-containing protein [Bacteroidales bacterium]|nr:GSCFA domain-containing protein [Bacteroidales bacterium]